MSASIPSQDEITVALREVIDPEVDINIIDLGLVYAIRIHEQHILIRMTMTTPACPLHASIRAEVETAIRRRMPKVVEVQIELVWDPPWHPAKMSGRAKRQLGWLGRQDLEFHHD